MSDVSTLILNEVREQLKRLYSEGIGYINFETSDSIQYVIDKRHFNITVEETDEIEGE